VAQVTVTSRETNNKKLRRALCPTMENADTLNGVVSSQSYYNKFLSLPLSSSDFITNTNEILLSDSINIKYYTWNKG
jgi:hypothetical protein